MKIKIKKILVVLTVLILISGLLSVCSVVFASSNLAYAGGLKDDDSSNIFAIDATNPCTNALIAYQNAGFSVSGHTNPTKSTLLNNIHATVQFYYGHGGLNFIVLGPKAGIIKGGNTISDVDLPGGKKTYESVQFIGTDTVNWNANTDLVSYLSCNSAGENSTANPDSVSGMTCAKGATVVTGYSSTVHLASLGNWSNRYNEKLGQGYGVLDAVNYANSFNYVFDDVKNVIVWHHGDPNIKIGKYSSSSKNSIISENNIFNNDTAKDNRLVYSSNVMDDTKISSNSEIESKLSEIYENFNSNNYIVEKNTSYCYDINTNLPTEENVYYSYRLKIGDYITNAGYTVKITNGVISEIYDNNIDIEKQEKLLKKSYEFNANINNENLSTYKSNLNKKVAIKYDNTVEIIENECILYYDIENDKKYVVVSCESEVKIDEEKTGKAIDSVMYEIE